MRPAGGVAARRVAAAVVLATLLVGAVVAAPEGAAVDASTLGWETVEPSPQARYEAGGTAVGGRLYVLGGYVNGAIESTARSDVYDPAADSWTRIDDLPTEVTHAPAVAVDGVIWLLGGFVGDHPGPSTTQVQRYDARSGDWLPAGPPLPERRGAGAAALVGRTIHYFGGVDRADGSGTYVDEGDHWALDVDDLDAGWQRRDPMPVPRNHLAGAALGGRVYAIGGQFGNDEEAQNRAEVHRYDPAADRWTRVADLPAGRGHTTASALADRGRLLVLGGTENGNVASRQVTAYDPELDAWTRLPDLPAGRKTPVAARIGERIVSSTGGGTASVETWTMTLPHRWEELPDAPVALAEVATAVVGGTLLVFGSGDSRTLAHDLGRRTWSTRAARPLPGDHHAAEVLDGRVYLVGGLGEGQGEVQVYDPAANTWSAAADLPWDGGSVSTAVIGGLLYAAGGIVDGATTRSAAVYDPETGAWTSLPQMPAGRNHAAAGTDGRRFFVIGGRGPGSGDGNVVADGFDDVQVFDPASRTWATSADPASGLEPLPQARGGMGRAVFVDGELLVFGGETADGPGATEDGVYARVDRYDPVANTWRRGADMPTPRHGIWPALAAGRVYLAAGGVQAGASRSAVLDAYEPGHSTPGATPRRAPARAAAAGAAAR